MLFFGWMGGVCIGVGIILELALGIYFLVEGEFTPYKFVGFTGFGFLVFGLLLLIVGLVADMLNRIIRTKKRKV